MNMKKVFWLALVILIVASTVLNAVATGTGSDVHNSENENVPTSGGSVNSNLTQPQGVDTGFSVADNDYGYIVFQKGLLLKSGTKKTDSTIIEWEFKTTDATDPATRIFTARNDTGNWALSYTNSDGKEILVYLTPSEDAVAENNESAISVLSKSEGNETAGRYEYDDSKGLLVSVNRVVEGNIPIPDVWILKEFLVTESVSVQSDSPSPQIPVESTETPDTPDLTQDDNQLDKERFLDELHQSIPWGELDESTSKSATIRVELNAMRNGGWEVALAEKIDLGMGATIGVILMFATAVLLIILNILIFLRRK